MRRGAVGWAAAVVVSIAMWCAIVYLIVLAAGGFR
jgi:hypothetical protein